MTLVRGVSAGEHFHEGALAGAILADEREDFAGVDDEVDAGQRLGRPKRLPHAFHAEALAR